ncbi:MAG: DNA repair protein RecN [Treponema sp.]|jgi:DNA repair protein RecN (Recombination protein N)|nr:DNA repair protein RecN [Treponema sp.]
MLEELSISNFALIERLRLTFERGFTVLTGETGAGKSIIVGALSFLLGAKAQAESIRAGADEASVSAVITVTDREALAWLAARDIALEDERLVVRRVLKASGRGSLYIQNVPVPRNDLAEFMALLFDLHGQHSHESLLRREQHRTCLDRFAQLEEETLRYHERFVKLAECTKAFEAKLRSARERDDRLEVLRYAVEEITAAALRSGEDELRKLENEAARLSDFEKLVEQVNAAAASFFDDDVSLLSLARKTRASLESAVSIDADLTALHKRMDDLYYEAEDIAGEFRAYSEGLTYAPQRLEEVEERLALLYRLKKKYGPDEAAILAYRSAAEAEIEELTHIEEHRDKLKAEIAALERDLAARAAAISLKRTAAAAKLGERVSAILTHLGMSGAAFAVAVRAKGMADSSPVCGPWGSDDVEFLIRANKGEPEKPLARIASGGELSRVMLAIKTVLSGADTLETLIFDEIDTGIGGEVALAVGNYLVKISERKQIFCVTHLASIAVRADNHLKVTKGADGGRTITSVTVLRAEKRRDEIARMLSGDSGEAALAHADDLLAKYGVK